MWKISMLCDPQLISSAMRVTLISWPTITFLPCSSLTSINSSTRASLSHCSSSGPDIEICMSSMRIPWTTVLLHCLAAVWSPCMTSTPLLVWIFIARWIQYPWSYWAMVYLWWCCKPYKQELFGNMWSLLSHLWPKHKVKESSMTPCRWHLPLILEEEF